MTIPLYQYLQLLHHYLQPQLQRVLMLAFLVVGTVGLQLLNPQIVRRFIDAASANGAPQELLQLALFFIGIALLQQIVAVCATYVSEGVAWQATNELRADLALHCLQVDLSFHNTHTPGELIERIDGDIDTLANFFSQFVIQLAGSLLLLFGILGLLWWEDWRLGLAFTLFAAISLALFYRIRHVAVPYWGEAREASANLFGWIEEHLNTREDVRANGATAYVLHGLYKRTRWYLQKERRAGLMGLILWAASRGMLTIGNVLAFLFGAYLFWTGAFTLGTVYLLFHYTEMLRYPLSQMLRQIGDLQRAAAGITRVQELVETENKLVDGPGVNVPSGALAVSFQQVTFSYSDQQTILHDLSFALQAGHVLGVLGRTGSGKTTLARLLFRQYDPTAGQVLLGGTDIRKFRLAELRRHIGLVTQTVELFPASVRDNLTFFDPAVPDTAIVQTLTEVGLGQWHHALPDGLDTELDAAGAGLSAGQAQLLAFARILLQDPAVVILDEASSRLDPATEALLDRALTRLFAGRTGIIIAHRLATIQRADKILILEDGRICEYGSRQSLSANRNSHFSQLLQTSFQRSRETEDGRRERGHETGDTRQGMEVRRWKTVEGREEVLV